MSSKGVEKDFARDLKQIAGLSRKIQDKPKPKKISLLVAKIIVIIFMVFLILPPFIYPISGRITSINFLRKDPTTKKLFDFHFHRGVDIAAPIGTKVHPTTLGRTKETGISPVYGNFVRINHIFGFSSFYAHLSVVTVKEDQVVTRFATIGKVGTTGKSTGPHLHFEIRFFGKSIPPRLLLVFHSIGRLIMGILT